MAEKCIPMAACETSRHRTYSSKKSLLRRLIKKPTQLHWIKVKLLFVFSNANVLVIRSLRLRILFRNFCYPNHCPSRNQRQKIRYSYSFIATDRENKGRSWASYRCIQEQVLLILCVVGKDHVSKETKRITELSNMVSSMFLDKRLSG